MGNNYRHTEQFFRRMEPYLIEAFTLDPDKWAIHSTDYAPSTLQVNCNFAVKSFIQNSWSFQVPYNDVVTRYSLYAFSLKFSAIHASNVVCWKPRGMRRNADGTEPIKATQRPDNFNDDRARIAALNIPTTDRNAFRAAIWAHYYKLIPVMITLHGPRQPWMDSELADLPDDADVEALEGSVGDMVGKLGIL